MNMAEWLILRLPPTPEASTQWLLADVQGQPLTPVASGSLADAAAQAGGRRVCALVPGGDVLVTEVDLPARAGARAAQLVPYALEEQLAADVDTLHFAIGPRVPGGSRTRVAVVARTLMDQWLAQLRAAQLAPTLICTAGMLLPDNPGHTLALLDEDVVNLRRPGDATPLTLPAADLTGGLTALLGAEPLAAEHLIVYADAQQWPRHADDAEALAACCASFKVQLLPTGVLPLLAPQLAQVQTFNLLQGSYALTTDHSADWRRWRLAAVLAAGLLVLHLGGQAFSLWRLDRAGQQLDASIHDVVTRSVPGDPGTGDVRARLQQRLLAAQTGSAGTTLMRGLDALARAQRSTTAALTLQALDLRNGTLEMKLRAADADSLERLIQALQGEGWQAQLTSGAAAGGSYEGSVTLHAAGA